MNFNNEPVQTVCLAQLERPVADHTTNDVIKTLEHHGYDAWGYPVRTPRLGKQYQGLQTLRPCQFKLDITNKPIIKKMEHSYQAQAAVVYTAGTIAAEPCDYCAQYKGAFQQCVTYTPILPDGTRGKPFFKGACCNCRYHNKASDCSFRGPAPRPASATSSDDTILATQAVQAAQAWVESSAQKTSTRRVAPHDQGGSHKRQKTSSGLSAASMEVNPSIFSEPPVQSTPDSDAGSEISRFSWSGLGKHPIEEISNGWPEEERAVFCPWNHMSYSRRVTVQTDVANLRGFCHELNIPNNFIGNTTYLRNTANDMKFFMDTIISHIQSLEYGMDQSAAKVNGNDVERGKQF